MPVNPAFTTAIQAGTPYYRITAVTFRTKNKVYHPKAVNGQGALSNPSGGRYNYPGAVTQLLHFTSGDVRLVGNPSGINTYDSFTGVDFNH